MNDKERYEHWLTDGFFDDCVDKNGKKRDCILIRLFKSWIWMQ